MYIVVDLYTILFDVYIQQFYVCDSLQTFNLMCIFNVYYIAVQCNCRYCFEQVL